MADGRTRVSRRSFITTLGTGAATLSGILPMSLDASSVPQSDAIILDAAAPILTPDTPDEALDAFVAHLKNARVGCVLIPVVTSEDWPTAVERILSFEPFLMKRGFVQVRTASQIRAATSSGRIAAIYGCCASYALGSPFDLRGAMISTFTIKRLQRLHELGVRVIQVTDDYKGYAGDGCTERTNCGLTDYGIWALKTMNELGLVVDCSHAGLKTSLEAIERSDSPVIFSHANVNAICASKCNLSDEQIRAVAAKGGVIGISALGSFVDPRNETLERYLDHLDYVSKLVGVDHVGIGLNYANENNDTFAQNRRDPAVYPKPPWTYAIKDPSAIPLVSAGLRARGYDATAVSKILGGNFLRIFEQVWKT